MIHEGAATLAPVMFQVVVNLTCALIAFLLLAPPNAEVSGAKVKAMM